LFLDGLGEVTWIAYGLGVIAEGGDHPLAQLTIRIMISFKELK
jgi:hypothetical protein